jgi:hypothetical protein
MFVGILLAFVTMWTVGDFLEPVLGDVPTFILIGGFFGALIGAGAGLGQALLVQGLGLAPGRWLIGTIIAGALGPAFALGLAFSLSDMEDTPDLVAGLLMGFSTGLPIALVQWQLMKGKISDAHNWIPICTASFLIGFGVGLPLGGENTAWLSLIVMSLLIAIISGAGMLMLVNGNEAAAAA